VASVELIRKQNEAKAQALQTWRDMVAALHKNLPTDGAAFSMWATLIHRKSDTLSEDAMIAAIARTHRPTVATRNVGGFKTFGVLVLNPFKAF
jgi:toxin FitB